MMGNLTLTQTAKDDSVYLDGADESVWGLARAHTGSLILRC